jgi:hypothetical protein
LRFTDRFLRQTSVTGIIFDQKDFNRPVQFHKLPTINFVEVSRAFNCKLTSLLRILALKN